MDEVDEDYLVFKFVQVSLPGKLSIVEDISMAFPGELAVCRSFQLSSDINT